MTRNKNIKFAAFILSHGRADNVSTYDSLRRFGYTGPIHIVIDNEDAQEDQYRKNFGDQIVQFDKLAVSKRIDSGDNFDNRKAILYARNEVFNIAKNLGYTHFMQLDDDYSSYYYKCSPDLEYVSKQVKSLDRIFEILIDFQIKTGCESIAMAQGGDFIGGAGNRYATQIQLYRKCMNTWLCATDKPFPFMGKMNEDMTTSIRLGHLGGLFFTMPFISTIVKGTQTLEGGMSGLYSQSGTYVKTFYSILYCPSFVKVSMMGPSHRRLHHKVKWENAVPRILNQSWRKK